MSRDKLYGVQFWENSQGEGVQFSVRMDGKFVELEHITYHGNPDLYSGNKTQKTLYIPSDPGRLRSVARTLLNIARWKEGAIDDRE